MLDVVCLGMIAVVAIMWWSIRLSQVHKNYSLHKRVQLILAGVLLVVLGAFETDVRLHGWQERAAGEIGGTASSSVLAILSVHLFFAVTTVILWIVVIVRALRNYSSPPQPNEHSAFHRRWARLAAWDMLLTTVTGWIFYVAAFVL